MKQTLRFPFLSLFVVRNIYSHTQGSYSVVTPGGVAVVGGFSLEAPYNAEAMVHVKRDGRQNPYHRTDEEIIEGLKHFIESGNQYFQGSQVQKLRQAIMNEFKGKRVQVPVPARDEQGAVVAGKNTTVAGICSYLGPNEILGLPLHITVDRLPTEVCSLFDIELI